MSEEKRRLQGSTLTAYGIALLLLVLAVTSACGGLERLSWDQAKRWIDSAAALAFALVLFAWAASRHLKDTDHHQPNTRTKIGFETVTMVVTVVTALIAIMTLTDSAASNERNRVSLEEQAKHSLKSE